MKTFLVLLPCIVCVLGHSAFVEWFSLIQSKTVKTKFTSYIHEWLLFKKTYNRAYKDLETEGKKYETFRENLNYIEDHNKLYLTGKKSFSVGINQFTDMTHEEFREYMHLNQLMKHNSEGASTYLPSSNVQLPDQVDWREKGYVTAVKNQGQCGSCWSFSTTGSLEGQHFKETGKLISLSEQQLVDCSTSFGDHGCQGGFMDYAFSYVKKYGLESEESYPYEAEQSNCRYQRSLVVANCTGYVDVTHSSESALKSAVATVGPVSIAIDANHRSFQHYHSGVYDEPACSSTLLDHGVLAVGYGADSMGGDYWLVKNSWGVSWGEEGYIKMSRNKDNQCGVASKASYPLV